MGKLCDSVIDRCIERDCNPVFKGVESIAYVFNKKEIASFTGPTSADPNVVTAITMGTDELNNNYVGYRIEQYGRTPFTGTTVEMVEGTFANKFTNTFQFMIPDNSPEAAALVDGIANGSLVAVIKNSYTGGDDRGQFQILGMQKGLKVSAVACDKYSDDSEGGWIVTLTEEGASKSAIFLEHKTGADVDTEDYLQTLCPCS